MKRHRSYVAIYKASPGKLLLGAVTHSVSSAYQLRSDAEAYLANTIELNGEHCTGEVVEVDQIADIVRHCGEHSQAVGMRCPGCRETITPAMAQKLCEVPSGEVVYKTRFNELGYAKSCPNVWRLIDLRTGNAIGPQYRTRRELLAELETRAIIFGATLKEKPKPKQLPHDTLFRSAITVVDALYNAHPDAHSDASYTRGLVVGLVAALMATGYQYAEAIKAVASCLPIRFLRSHLPEAFTADIEREAMRKGE